MTREESKRRFCAHCREYKSEALDVCTEPGHPCTQPVPPPPADLPKRSEP